MNNLQLHFDGRVMIMPNLYPALPRPVLKRMVDMAASEHWQKISTYAQELDADAVRDLSGALFDTTHYTGYDGERIVFALVSFPKTVELPHVSLYTVATTVEDWLWEINTNDA
jgi:hypothetical protein